MLKKDHFKIHHFSNRGVQKPEKQAKKGESKEDDKNE